MLFGQPPAGWPVSATLGMGFAANPLTARFGPYQLQPYALPAPPPAGPVQPMPLAPALPRAGTRLDPWTAYLLKLHQQGAGWPPFGTHGGGEGGQGPRGGVGSVGGSQHEHRGYDGGG